MRSQTQTRASADVGSFAPPGVSTMGSLVEPRGLEPLTR